MLKGLALTPPVVGRISIGRVVERNGKRLPEKDDEFTVTTQVHGREGWIPHPVDQELRKTAGEKLRSIPVTLLFDDPDLNLRASYSMFDRRTGRPLCVGDGKTCKRVTSSGMQTLDCPAPEGCAVGQAGGCKPYGRLNVRIGDEDELGSFIFRTTGFNSIRTLATRLSYFHAITGGHLSTLHLLLRLRGKSTTQSHGSPIYFADLTTRAGVTLASAVAEAKLRANERADAGFQQALLDQAGRRGLECGAFEDSPEDGASVVEEFFPTEGNTRSHDAPAAGSTATLAQKLARRAGDRVPAEAECAPAGNQGGNE